MRIRPTSYDFGGSLGGPLMRDKLWFFGAIDPTRSTTYLGGVLEDGATFGNPVSRQYDRESNIYAGKITCDAGAEPHVRRLGVRRSDGA